MDSEGLKQVSNPSEFFFRKNVETTSWDLLFFQR